MKYTLLILLTIHYCNGIFSQESREPYIKNYFDKEYTFFDSVNNLYNKEIVCFNITNEVYATFRVDTNSTVINLQIAELPIYKLPATMRAYLEKLIRLTNGKWESAMRNNQKVVSHEIMYRFDLVKAAYTMQQRLNESVKIVDYNSEYGYNLEMVKKFDRLGNGKNLRILY